MNVLKFGGTSLGNSTRFMQAAKIIVHSHEHRRSAVVLSAPAKVTNLLVKTLDDAIAGEDFLPHITAIKVIFDDLVYGLASEHERCDHDHLSAIIKTELSTLEHIANQAQLQRSLSDALKAQVHCIGEQLSIAIMEHWLNALGYDTYVIDPRIYLRAHGDYLTSSVDLATSAQLISTLDLPVKAVILMAGFTAHNPQGETVLLGRNGSDYSAACLAYCLGANECQIWTDVDGVYSSDPHIIASAVRLDSISYDEATELAKLGAQVIHPRTIEPLRAHNIPCIIKNTNQPSGQGTRISYTSTDKSIKGVTHLTNIALIELTCEQSIAPLLKKIIAKLNPVGIRLINDHELSLGMPSNQLPTLQDKIAHCAIELNLDMNIVKITSDLAIISVVGEALKHQHQLSDLLLERLNERHIEVIAPLYTLTTHSIALLVASNTVLKALRAIHRVLFDDNPVITIAPPTSTVPLIAPSQAILCSLLPHQSIQHNQAQLTAS